MNSFGADILELYIPLIETYVIRENSEFIDDSESFVIFEGLIKGEKPNGAVGTVYSEGMLIESLN